MNITHLSPLTIQDEQHYPLTPATDTPQQNTPKQDTLVQRHALSAMGLWNFRHTEHSKLEPNGRSVMLYGSNGRGKTNILEAVSLLSPSRGVRQANADLYLNRTADPKVGWQIKATMESGYTLSTHWQAGQTSRHVKIEDEKTSQQQLGMHCRCLSLGPRDDQIFTQGDESIRRFMDRLISVFDPAHVGRVQQLRQLLKQWRDLVETLDQADTHWLSAIEKQLAAKMVAVSAARRVQAHSLCQMLASLPDLVARNLRGKGRHWQLTIDGEIQQRLHQQPAVLVEESLCVILSSSRRHPRSLNRLGDQWQFNLCSLDTPAIAVSELSHGQQKIALLAVMLAQAWLMRQDLQIMPILLLDEALNQLDTDHSDMLFTHLKQLSCQFWITGVDLSAWKNTANALYLNMNSLETGETL